MTVNIFSNEKFNFVISEIGKQRVVQKGVFRKLVWKEGMGKGIRSDFTYNTQFSWQELRYYVNEHEFFIV